MEFEGRIIRVFPTRTGTSQRGEWKALPFVFAYYESGEQRFEDRVMLETFDTNTMKQIVPYCVTDGEGKAVIENGSFKMKGLLAWFAWMFVHLLRLSGAHTNITVCLKWFWNFVSGLRLGRIITNIKD